MKKALAIVLAIVMIAALFIIPAAAEEYTRVDSYTGGVSVGVWTGNTDNRKNTHGVAFNVAADFRYIGLPQYWNSNGTNQPLVTYVVELFNYNTDYATSVAGTPVFSQEVHPEGDAANGIQFDLGKTMPKGAYALRFTVTSDQGYMVLPSANSAYTNARIAYTDETFGFYIDFVEAGLSNYFVKMPDAGEELLDGILIEKGGDPVDMKLSGAFGIRFTVPEGYALRALLGTDSPTWSNPGGGSSACANIYKWNTDYETSVAGDSLAYAEEIDHADNATLVLTFNKDVPAGEYLAVIESIGENSIGFWCNTTSTGEATEVYLNGAAADKYPGIKYRLLVLEPETTEEPAAGLRDFDSAKGDHMSYDQILVNDAEIANGNDAVIAAKALIDGSDGTIETVAMYGWYGNDNSKIESFGYMIDNNDPVYGEFKFEPTEQAVIDNGGESRYKIVIDVTGLKDGKTHKIQAVAKLENGEIVKLNRNDNGTKDRDAYVNYKAQLVEEPNTQTGDATVAIFAVIAVLALGAVVVFSKKRAF